MATTLNEIIARAEALRKESYVNSIDPERVGSIMSDTLKYLNEFQLQSGSMGLDKIYASVSAMNADTSPMSDLTGKPLKAGQLAVIVASGDEDEDNGKVWLEPDRLQDNDSGTLEEAVANIRAWGVHHCGSWDDYNGYVQCLGDDAMESAYHNEEGMTLC